jgi:hypothetical protein
MTERFSALLTWCNGRLIQLRQRVSRRTQRWIEVGINLFLLAVVALIIYQNSELLPTLGQSLALGSLVSCLGLYLLSLSIQAAIWIDLMGYRPGERRAALADYIQTTLMGRLPGGWWKWFGRVTVYRAAHLSTRAILLVNLIELLLLMLTAGIVIALLLPIAWYWRLLAIAVQSLAVGGLLWRLAPIVPGLQRRFIFLRAVVWSSGYILAWGCGALILYLLAQPFSRMQLDLFVVLRLTCLSGVVNLLFQLLPVSLLFRDLTLLALLGSFMSSAQAVVVIFALRLVSSVCELLSSWILVAAVRLFPAPPAAVAAPTDQAL